RTGTHETLFDPRPCAADGELWRRPRSHLQWTKEFSERAWSFLRRTTSKRPRKGGYLVAHGNTSTVISGNLFRRLSLVRKRSQAASADAAKWMASMVLNP